MNHTKIMLNMICWLTTLQISTSQPPLNHKSTWQKTLDSIGKSEPMCWFEKNISTKLFPCSFDGGPATLQYQELGKEAQYAVGIAENYHVPIKRISPKVPMGLIAGTTKPNAIYINEETLTWFPYGVRRCITFHEAIHKKYNDNSTLLLLGVTTNLLTNLLSASPITYTLLPSAIKPRTYSHHMCFATIASCIITIKTCLNHHHYAERRADIEGCYATQCSTCVQEINQVKILKSYGYLENEEFGIIAQELEKQNKKCTYHRNNT